MQSLSVCFRKFFGKDTIDVESNIDQLLKIIALASHYHANCYNTAAVLLRN